MLKHILIIFVLFFQLHIVAKERPPTFRVLIMCDTTSSNIKKASFMDLEKMRKVTKSIAHRLKMKSKITILKGKKLSSAPFSKWMKTLPFSSNDIVIFYYSGHGFRLETDETPWPSFLIKNAQKSSFLVPGEKVYNDLKQHAPRFALVLFDCCNYEISFKAPSLAHKLPSLFRRGSLPGLRTLFTKLRGMVTISASSPGEFGIAITGGKHRGSIFTSQFLLSLLKACRTEDTTWQQVIRLTSQRCLKISGKTQTPIGLVEVFDWKTTGNSF